MVSEHGILIYPHQLFKAHPALSKAGQVFLIEHRRFFSALAFHKQKLVLHRAAMRAYAQRLSRKARVHYLPHDRCTEREVLVRLRDAGVKTLHMTEPCDPILTQEAMRLADKLGAALDIHDTPMFLTSTSGLDPWFEHRERFHMKAFYTSQRRGLNILMSQGKPMGGKWSFDAENRRRLPPGISVPEVTCPKQNNFVREAIDYVNIHFAHHPGRAEDFRYPINHTQASKWLDEFLFRRLAHFGPYEDAMSQQHTFLFHAVLTPMLNIGLITPSQVLDRVADFSANHELPLASLEGFLRQLIGWREFMWGVYRAVGAKQRQSNFWRFHNTMPQAFYDGSTGMGPVDTVIHRVRDHAYCHHIERLMVLGNFMFLCEIHPDEVYQWFMELFIDAYDWVMVPNVYGMSQYADGGLITTKPYISSSNYIRKMSDFPKGDWCDIWDALFWRLIGRYPDVFAANPRMRMMAVQWDRMDARKKNHHNRTAEAFLGRLFDA